MCLLIDVFLFVTTDKLSPFQPLHILYACAYPKSGAWCSVFIVCCGLTYLTYLFFFLEKTRTLDFMFELLTIYDIGAFYICLCGICLQNVRFPIVVNVSVIWFCVKSWRIENHTTFFFISYIYIMTRDGEIVIQNSNGL